MFKVSYYVADLKTLGVTNVCNFADDTTLLVPEVCDIKIEDELENIMKWSNVNKLQLNLAKSIKLCSGIQMYKWTFILPLQINSNEQSECLKLLGFFYRFKIIV